MFFTSRDFRRIAKGALQTVSPIEGILVARLRRGVVCDVQMQCVEGRVVWPTMRSPVESAVIPQRM